MQKNPFIYIVLVGALAPAACWASDVQTAPRFAGGFQKWRTPWSYQGEKGPDHWASLDPDYATCATGRNQSPIDIRATTKAKLPKLEFDFRNGPVNIVNNGYTAVRVDYSPGNGNSLTIGPKSYELTQFHFHHPGEEKINGKSYDMVLHLMYRSRDAQVVGVAVPLKRGQANGTIAQLWAHMPQTPGKYQLISGLSINLAGLLPKETGYYRYDGSVSAPPCNEPVTWFVLKSPVEISAEQIGAFAKLYPHDVRPIQPTNGRIVMESD